MKKYIRILYFVGAALVLNSCEKDLDVLPEDDDILLTENFYNTPGAYRQAIAGVYSNLALPGATDAGTSSIQGVDPGTSQYGRCLWYLQCLSTEEAVWSYEADPGVREIQRGIWTASNPLFQGMFSRAMYEVSLANEFLRQSAPEKLASRNVSAADLAEMPYYRAEARVLRALAYYHLMDTFGKAAFVTEADPVSTSFKPQQYERAQLYAFIESELNDVMDDLKPARGNEFGRVDRAVAQMILAKVYLNAEVYVGQNKYAECRALCESIIASGYTLASNYLNNFNADNSTNEAAQKEIIFALQADGNVTQSYGPTTVMINGAVGSVEQNGASLGVGASGWGGAIRVRSQFSQKFEDSAFDMDARNTILSQARPMQVTDISDKATGYIVTKYSNRSSAGVAGPNSTFVDTDFPLFRLADVYLMYAECVLRGGGGTNALALQYVNALRTRANNGSTAHNISGSDLTLNFILDERSRELYWESHRRQDLIRFNKFTGGSYNWDWKGNAPAGIALPEHMKVYPLPTNSLASNPNLTQNTGY